MEHSHRYFLKGNVTVQLTSSLPGLDLVGNDNRFTFLTKSKPVTGGQGDTSPYVECSLVFCIGR